MAPVRDAHTQPQQWGWRGGWRYLALIYTYRPESPAIARPTAAAAAGSPNPLGYLFLFSSLPPSSFSGTRPCVPIFQMRGFSNGCHLIARWMRGGNTCIFEEGGVVVVVSTTTTAATMRAKKMRDKLADRGSSNRTRWRRQRSRSWTERKPRTTSRVEWSRAKG